MTSLDHFELAETMRAECRLGGTITQVAVVAGWAYLLSERGEVTVQETFRVSLNRLA